MWFCPKGKHLQTTHKIRPNNKICTCGTRKHSKTNNKQSVTGFLPDFLLFFALCAIFVQIQSICRRQNDSYWKNEKCFGKGRKHCGKRCWLSGFFPFLQYFQKSFSTRFVLSYCFIQGKNG